MPSPGADPILDDLTDSQRAAVTHGEGPLLVVAGAGSGKTRVITRRIAHLVREGHPPERIPAITFTNKAADEMRHRVESLVGRGVRVRTFHSLCAWILRRHIDALGMDGDFSIYDRRDSSRVIREVRDELNLDKETYSPSDLLQDISRHKDNVDRPEDVAEAAVGTQEKTLARVYRRYEEKLRQNNALDFDDLLLKTVDLFSAAPEVLQQYQHTYRHLLVDEYQDTNLPQHLIAHAIQGHHRNFTAVGDPDQMIYTWRGARLANIMEFEEDFPGARIVKLERNYRSSANILKAAATSIAHNIMRHEKELWTERGPGEPVVVKEFPNCYEEAEWLAEKAQELFENGERPVETAVLYRTKYQSLQLEEALAALSIPYQVVDTVGFFDRKAVKDLRAYIQLLINPRDDAAFLRIVNVPTRGIGKKTVQQLQQIAETRRQSLCMAIQDEDNLSELRTRARRAVENFRDLYNDLDTADYDSVLGFVKYLLERIEYIESFAGQDRADIEEVVDYFLGYAKQYDERHPGGSLRDFLEHTALISDVDGWNSRADAMSLMTLHSAKGLEFDNVFIVGLDEGFLPHRRSLEDHVHGDENAALEEERRLFHVGMTRARHRLFLTHAESRMIHGRQEFVNPSRFLSELPEKAVKRQRAGDLFGTASASQFGQDVQRIKKKKTKKKERSEPPASASVQNDPLLKAVDGSGDEAVSEGARLRHKSYGEGTVVKVQATSKRQLLTIDFDEHGVLTMLVET
mgnify:CR=1 FL=1